MTKQEYYDLLVASAQDGTMPGYENGKCRYRTSDGHKCAIGIIIPEERYLSEMENFTIRFLSQEYKANELISVDGMDIGDLMEIQSLHDHCAWDGWKPDEFIRHLNRCHCFADVQQAQPA